MTSQSATELLTLPIDELQANPLQPRGSITSDSVEDLAKSIKDHGILEPLVVAKTPVGYQIIAGERRWRAAKLAGLSHVPATVKKTSRKGMLEMAIVENVQRSDLNPMDRARAFERLQAEFGLTSAQIAERVAKSTAYVSNTLRLLTLPDTLKDGVIDGDISEGHARALAQIKDNQAMIDAYHSVVKQGSSVRKTEELARRINKSLDPREDDEEMEAWRGIVAEELEKMKNRLQKSIGDDSQVSLKQSSKESVLRIVIKGGPEQTSSKIRRIYDSLKRIS